MISSPHARRGELWRAYKRHFGPDGDRLILVAKAPTWVMNTTLPRSVIDRAYERDPIAAASEYGSDFRSDLEQYVSLEAVEACVTAGVFERAPERGVTYSAFCDPSGGSQDSMTLCVGHVDHARETIVVDALREAVPPFSPEAVVREFSAVLQNYRIGAVLGDAYGGLWPTEQFSKFNIRYEKSVAAKSALYIDMLALLNSGRIQLLDHPKSIAQIVSLERSNRRCARDSIDHPPSQHDDIANVIAGLASTGISKPGFDLASYQRAYGDGESNDPNIARDERTARRVPDWVKEAGLADHCLGQAPQDNRAEEKSGLTNHILRTSGHPNFVRRHWWD